MLFEVRLVNLSIYSVLRKWNKRAESAWLADGSQIDENYYRKEIKIVDQRLALAGLRLAAMLN
jgi:hypothetical protein